MAGNTERKLLERSKKGDEIAIGFQRTARNSNLALEHIRKLVDGKYPNLKVRCAFEVDTGTHNSYNYITHETTPCPDAKIGGSFMLLACTTDVAKPSELLQPVYDFCDCLSKAPDIWYHQDGLGSGGGYEIAEARVSYIAPPPRLPYIFYPCQDGTYYVDRMKMLRVIEKLTLPPMEGGNSGIRGMVERDAYYLHKDYGFNGPDLNWQLAQSGLVSKIICHMRRDNRWVRISGRLETDSIVRELMSEVEKYSSYVNLFRELQGDDSIHLAPAGPKVWLYQSGYWTWAKESRGVV